MCSSHTVGHLMLDFLKWPEGDQNQGTGAGEALGTKVSTGGKRAAELCKDPEGNEGLIRVMWAHNCLWLLMLKVGRSLSHMGISQTLEASS